MPNVKIFVDQSRLAQVQDGLIALLPEMRRFLCSAFGVDALACQIAVIGVLGLPDQPQINTELHILARPDRTRDAVQTTAHDLRAMLAQATGLHVAVRIAGLDPATYVALK